jgi:murein DD-endopeptidase MepM/ murein hydrolase activator NlpD
MQGHPPERRGTTAAKRIALAAFVSVYVLLGAIVAFSASDTTGASGPSEVRDDNKKSARGEGLATPALGAVAVARPPVPEPPPLDVIEGAIETGSTLASSLADAGVPSATVHRISSELAGHFDFRHARAGHTYRLARDAAGAIVSFDYQTSESSGYRLLRVGDGFEVERQDVELVPRPALIAGLVTTTLYGAIVDLGEHGQLARDFADVFAWDIDFQRSVRPGDAFQIVYERLHKVELDGTETYQRPGRILAARYDGGVGRHTAIYFEPEQGRGGYYHPDGRSVEGEFLMSPLRDGRITSSFSAARHHPILKVTRPHKGIDYAAPHGTAVWAVADGKVIYKARAGGYGNLIKVRHRNGHVSYYAHLSRYAAGLRVGSRVEQKQVIGYVGSTGLATGPHVCFRVQQDGQFVNPAKLRSGAREAISAQLMPAFDASRDVLLARLDGGAIVGSLGKRPQAARSEAQPSEAQ